MNENAKPSKLGRGLFDLMEETAAARTMTPLSSGGLMRLPLDVVKPGPWQARMTATSEDNENLVQSIRDRGVLHPILVRRVGETFELIAGRRRLEAAKAAGLKDIQALVMQATDQQCIELFLVENLQRKELPPDYRNWLSDELTREYGITPDQLKELLRTELPTPPPPPPPPPVEVKSAPPSSAVAVPITLATPTRTRKTWLWMGSAIAASFVLGMSVLWMLLYLPASRQALVTNAEPVVAEPAPSLPAQLPLLPELSVTGTHSVETAGKRVILFDAPVFQYGTVFSGDLTNTLQQLAAAMNDIPNAIFRIVGHTGPDPLPTTDVYADNYALGLARAEAVYNYLRTSGRVAVERLTIGSLGGDEPPWPIDAPGARAKNRTVTIELIPQNELRQRPSH
ncbi:MAG TPA: hypothetical protein DCZ95_03490 [Verrucomicrobia bacterium]|nr:MAG: hypothetical protein A2X46_01475 [Lentisphaerae bacterium GWF2_57_35]HBA83137.1 hypothetical protein [Verrucomicrobiota bacterium]